MCRFLPRAMAAVVVLAGLTVLDLGQSAHADYISCCDSGPAMGAAEDDFAVSSAQASQPHDSQVFPPPPVRGDSLQDQLLAASCRGGAGGVRHKPTSSGKSHTGLLPTANRGSQERIAFRLVFEGPPLVSPPPSSIFHPPRSSRQG